MNIVLISLINAYTENGAYDKAFETFDEMHLVSYCQDIMLLMQLQSIL